MGVQPGKIDRSKDGMMDKQESREKYLIEWRKGLWEQIRQKEDAIWRFISFYAGALVLAAGFVQGTDPTTIPVAGWLIIILTLIVVSLWGVAVVLDANFWMQRNLLFIGNIERELLPESDLGVLIPRSYVDPPRFRFIRSYRIHAMMLFFTIFLALIGCAMVTLKPAGVSDAVDVAVAGFLALTFCFGLLYAIARDRQWYRSYMQVRTEAPGRNAIPQKYPPTFLYVAFRCHSPVAWWGWLLAFVGSGIFVLLACLSNPCIHLPSWANLAIPATSFGLALFGPILQAIGSKLALPWCQDKLDKLSNKKDIENQRCLKQLNAVCSLADIVQTLCLVVTSLVWLLTTARVVVEHIGSL